MFDNYADFIENVCHKSKLSVDDCDKLNDITNNVKYMTHDDLHKFTYWLKKNHNHDKIQLHILYVECLQQNYKINGEINNFDIGILLRNIYYTVEPANILSSFVQFLININFKFDYDNVYYLKEYVDGEIFADVHEQFVKTQQFTNNDVIRLLHINIDMLWYFITCYTFNIQFDDDILYYMYRYIDDTHAYMYDIIFTKYNFMLTYDYIMENKLYYLFNKLSIIKNMKYTDALLNVACCEENKELCEKCIDNKVIPSFENVLSMNVERLYYCKDIIKILTYNATHNVNKKIYKYLKHQHICTDKLFPNDIFDNEFIKTTDILTNHTTNNNLIKSIKIPKKIKNKQEILQLMFVKNKLSTILKYKNEHNLTVNILCCENAMVNNDIDVVNYVCKEHNFVPSIGSIVRICYSHRRTYLMARFYFDLLG